jgi:hypothetical protein
MSETQYGHALGTEFEILIATCCFKLSKKAHHRLESGAQDFSEMVEPDLLPVELALHDLHGTEIFLHALERRSVLPSLLPVSVGVSTYQLDGQKAAAD